VAKVEATKSPPDLVNSFKEVGVSNVFSTKLINSEKAALEPSGIVFKTSELFCLNCSKNFRYTGSGLDFLPANSTYDKYSFQHLNAEGIWETKFSIGDIPILTALLAPIGLMYDKYYIDKSYNSNLIAPFNEANVGLFAELMLAPLTELTQLDFMETAASIITNLSSTIEEMTKGVRDGEGPEAKKMREEISRMKKLARTASVIVPGNANIYKQSHNMYMDIVKDMPKTSVNMPFETGSYKTDIFVNHLVDNTIYGKLFLEQSTVLSTLGLPVPIKTVVPLAPDALEDLIDRGYYSATQKKLIDHIKKLPDYKEPIPKPLLFMAETKSARGTMVPVVTGITGEYKESAAGLLKVNESMADFVEDNIDYIESFESEAEFAANMQKAYDMLFDMYEGNEMYNKIVKDI
jgi:hypothetical protein